MVPYFLLAILPLLIGFGNVRYRININKKTLIESRSGCIDMFMLLLLFMLSLRGLECGIDTRQYLRLFNEYGCSSFSGLFSDYEREFGFKLLNKLIYTMGGDFQILLFTTALVCVLPLWNFYKRESEIQPLTVVLFLSVAPFVMYFSGIRQSMSMSLGVLAWCEARDKRPLRFLGVIFLAVQLHASAFILLVLYPLYHARITLKWLWFVVPCMCVVFVFRTAVFNYLFELLWKDYNLTEATGATTMLILLILFGVYSYVIADESNLDKDTIALRNILLLSIMIQIFAMLHPLSMRMNYYFLIFVPILIPKIAMRCKKHFVQVSKMSVWVMSAYFLYYFVDSVIKDNDALNIYPYIPFWQN